MTYNSKIYCLPSSLISTSSVTKAVCLKGNVSTSTSFILSYLLLSNVLHHVCAQKETLVFSIDTEPEGGLIFMLLVLVFLVNTFTPIGKWIYINYLEVMVEAASKQLEKVSKRLSEKLSDAQRMASQSVRRSTEKV